MAYFEALPFQRGDTYEITGSTDGAYMLGSEYIVEDKDPADPMKKRSNRLVHLRAVRNSATIAVAPKRIVRYKTGTKHTEVDGYTNVAAGYFAGVVDEFLPSGGAAVNDVFFITVKGPTLCSMPSSALAADVAEDDTMVTITAAATTSVTAGRLAAQDLTGATAVLAVQVMNRVGRAMSTALTNATNSDLLIDVRCDY